MAIIVKDQDVFDDDIPSVAPARDEIASYNRTRGGRPTARAGGGGMGGGAKFFLFLAFVLAAAACAGAGYLYQELQKTSTALTEATERVGSLEDRLSSTDESVSESAAVQGVKIKELASEVDKLWASAWRKNQAELGKYGKQLGQQQATLGKAEKSLAAQQQSLQALQAEIGNVQGLTSLVKDTQSASIAQRAQLSEIDESLAAVKTSVSNLQKKVAENQEWVKSFNTFRRQVNSKLTSFENSLRAQRSASPSQANPQPPG